MYLKRGAPQYIGISFIRQVSMIEQREELFDLLQQANQSIKQSLLKPINKSNKQPSKPNPAKAQSSFEDTSSQSFFDKIGDFHVDISLETKITNLKFTQFTQRRRDEIFKRFKKDQQQKLSTRKKNAQRIYHSKDGSQKLMKGQFTLKNEAMNRTQTFPITAQDMDKLKPYTDLNDTIVGNYLKLLQFVFLPQQVDQKCHIFSSFFLEKLINEVLKEEFVYDKDPIQLIEQVRDKVKENYKNVKRWTKRIDIFEKEYLVFPINAFRHWNCILVLRPNTLLTNQSKCEIIICDSMFEKKEFIVEAIRKYIQYQLHQKKGIKIELDEETMPSYQLLLPRQTNNHDCGLYMMSYIEELLTNPKELENISIIKNRKKLQLFPRTLIYTMRQRLKNLFTLLINAKDESQKNQILVEYKGERQRLIKQVYQAQDFDQINTKEYKKYEKINFSGVEGSTPQQKSYACQIKFYLDTEINYYEKDK